MATVTDELKEEHAVLAQEIQQMKKEGIISEAGRKRFFKLKEKLIAHLKKEDDEIYPILNEAAKTDPVLKGQLSAFQDEMKDISKKAMDFFAKYEQDSKDPAFTAEIAGLLALLSSRIRKEEMILYKRFDDISAKDEA